MRSPLEPEVQLDVLLSAICGRNQYTRDSEPVVAELTAAAAGQDDTLAQTAGIWVGYFESPERTPLTEALLRIPDAAAWIEEGRRRRGIPRHSAPRVRP